MHTKLFRVFLGVLFCALLVLPARAGAIDGDFVTIQGVVTSTEFGLVLNDGSTDYLLLGVNDTQLEGMTCVVIGLTSNTLGIEAINVESIEIIGDAASHNYSLFVRPEVPASGRGAGPIYRSCLGTPGTTGPSLCPLRPTLMHHSA